MEMNFREYAEAWGTLAGTAGGAALGGWPGAVVGGALGYGAEKLYDRWKNPQFKPNPKYFVYYRDMPDQQYPQGKIVKELLPQRNGYVDIGAKWELKNADPNHPYYYFGKEVPDGEPRVIPRIKAGYLHHQRATRQGTGAYGGYGQQRRYGQQYGGYGQQQQRRRTN